MPILFFLADAAGGGDGFGWWVGAGGLAAAVLTALVGAYLKIREGKTKERQTTIEEYQEILHRMVAENDTLKADNAAKAVAIDAGLREIAEQRGRNIVYYAAVCERQDTLAWLIPIAEKQGAMARLPEMPPAPPNGPSKAARAAEEFRQAQHEQSSRLLATRVDELLKKGPADKGEARADTPGGR